MMKLKSFIPVLLLSCAASFLLLSCRGGNGGLLDPNGNPLGPPEISVTPGSINIEVDKGKTVDIELKIKNVGGFPLTISAIESQEDWIQFEPLSAPIELAAADSFLLPVTLGEPSLDARAYFGAIRFNSNAERQPAFDTDITLNVTEEVLLFEPTLTNIQKFVFSPICTECHIGAGAPKSLVLSEGNSFDNLVSVRSVNNPVFFRVEPFNPDDSYLIKKLEGSPDISGGRMPLNRTPLTRAQIRVIRRWISNGAQDN